MKLADLRKAAKRGIDPEGCDICFDARFRVWSKARRRWVFFRFCEEHLHVGARDAVKYIEAERPDVCWRCHGTKKMRVGGGLCVTCQVKQCSESGCGERAIYPTGNASECADHYLPF